MRSLRALLCAGVLLTLLPLQTWAVQRQEKNPSGVPTFLVKSSLVFLDVTVLDKKGRPVVKGLTKDDFTITEDNKPQRIFSFEAPNVHVMGANPENQNPEGEAPKTIFVLDRLNSSIADFVHLRNSLHKYLAAQPRELRSPTELMLLGNRSLKMLQGYTRNRGKLMFALDHLPSAIPFKYEMAGYWWRWERAALSYDALDQIALQNRGVPGRKNIFWVGHGGPSILTPDLAPGTAAKLMPLVRETVNTLVDARVSLFVFYPGLKFNPDSSRDTLTNSFKDVPNKNVYGSPGAVAGKMRLNGMVTVNDDPFMDDVSFGRFANETGGKLFYNRNDVTDAISQAQQMGSEYYTLTYQPPQGDQNGKFRRIRVTLRDPKLRAVTKDGYYAPGKSAPVNPRQQISNVIFQAVQARVPFTALEVKVTGIVQHPDTGTADFTVELKTSNIHWLSADGGMRTAKVILAGASLTGDRNILALKSKVEALTAKTQNSTRLAAGVSRMRLTLPVPRKTQRVRVVIVTEEDGRIGTVDLDRAAIDAAPASPSVPPR